jgi:GT2 family glycosyltransferase
MNDKIAVLITCFNRRSKTLDCLKSLFKVAPNVDVYLVDDNSSDGTSDAVKELYPKVNIIQGDGNLYWNRGMHLAWEHAAKSEYNFYLWLNDDVLLYPDFFDELMICANNQNNQAIITGLIENEQKDAIIYGGTDSFKRLWQANGFMNPVANLNGNVVLVSKEIFEILGNLDYTFQHDFGDVDYGLKAIKQGIGVYTTRKAIASGQENKICRVRLNNASLFTRYKRLYSPLGSNPFIQFYFLRKHKGLSNAITFFIFLHILNLIPDNMNKRIFGEKYT